LEVENRITLENRGQLGWGQRKDVCTRKGRRKVRKKERAEEEKGWKAALLVRQILGMRPPYSGSAGGS